MDSSSDSNIQKSTDAAASDKIHQTAFHNLKEGVIILRQDGSISSINPAAGKILYTNQLKENNENLNFYRFIDSENNEVDWENRPTTRLINKESFGNETYTVEIKKNGPQICAVFSGVPQFDAEGNFIGGILFIHEAEEKKDADCRSYEKEETVKTRYSRQLELFQKQAEQDRELLRLIIDTIPVMITIYEKQVDKVYLNAATKKITGWTNEDVKQRNIMELAYPNPEYRKEVMQFMESLQTGFKDLVMRTKDGRDIETSWANVKIPDGRQVGVGIDISERKRLERELILAREKAEKENQIQYAFIQNISHEVRTPMNSILGYSELLSKRIKGKVETEFINAVEYNGKQLLRLIDDIIDISRLDKNELSLTKEKIPLGKLMEQMHKLFAGLLKTYGKKHLNLELNFPEDNYHEIALYTDVYRLQQVFGNLISNAVKYTEKGKVTLGFIIRRKKQDILFYIKDTGIGIKKEDHSRVFTRFNRFHNTSESEFRGTGLGLSICKHLMSLLGGKIWFESEYGNGSVFYFNHPYVKPVSEEKPEKPECTEKNYQMPNLKNKTILIAEDDTFSYRMMHYMLEPTKAGILHADTGRKAVELINKNDVDLLFLDIRLPEMDGYEVIQHIRKAGKNLPVIAQTASVLNEDRQKIKTSGFNYHATKPISQNELFGILNHYL
ncbi:MAG: ATP-binding protein [Prolixibacteraceae bacterium]